MFQECNIILPSGSSWPDGNPAESHKNIHANIVKYRVFLVLGWLAGEPLLKALDIIDTNSPSNCVIIRWNSKLLPAPIIRRKGSIKFREYRAKRWRQDTDRCNFGPPLFIRRTPHFSTAVNTIPYVGDSLRNGNHRSSLLKLNQENRWSDVFQNRC